MICAVLYRAVLFSCGNFVDIFIWFWLWCGKIGDLGFDLNWFFVGCRLLKLEFCVVDCNNVMWSGIPFCCGKSMILRDFNGVLVLGLGAGSELSWERLPGILVAEESEDIRLVVVRKIFNYMSSGSDFDFVYKFWLWSLVVRKVL